MIPIDQAWTHIDACAQILPPESVKLERALGRTLAEEVHADADQPAFNRSSIDGFAVAEDQPGRSTFRVTDEALPGYPAPRKPAPGEAIRVCTGSALPEGVALVMVEDTALVGDEVTFSAPPKASLIRKRASSMRAGEELLQSGSPIGAGEIAVLASVGTELPRVIRQARVIHVVTGTEIVPHTSQPGPGQIRDTNGPLIRALLTHPGIDLGPTLYADESVASVAEPLKDANFDMLLVSGGASAGHLDNTPEVLRELGFEIVFHRVNVKPGKPLLFARRGSQLAFGIPGNPVSHFACAHLFIQRALARLGGRPTPTLQSAQLAAGATLRSDSRDCFWPARRHLDAKGQLLVEPLPWTDSGDTAALRNIDALIRLPANEPTPATGDPVSILAPNS